MKRYACYLQEIRNVMNIRFMQLGSFRYKIVFDTNSLQLDVLFLLKLLHCLYEQDTPDYEMKYWGNRAIINTLD